MNARLNEVSFEGILHRCDPRAHTGVTGWRGSDRLYLRDEEVFCGSSSGLGHLKL